MLGLDKKSLMFPKLVYLRDVQLVSEPIAEYASNPPPTDPELIKLSKTFKKPKPQTLRLYCIDWSRMEAAKDKQQQDRVSKLMIDGDIPGGSYPTIPSLPQSYRDRMDRMVFAIPASYMAAINHCSTMAMQEWEHKYPFDTIIREGCYEPAAAFVKVAFHLLQDCVYDPKAQNYNHDWGLRQVFEQTALVRYWMHQVGTWVAFDAAGLRQDKSTGRMHNTFIATTMGEPNIEAMMADMMDFADYVERTTVRVSMPSLESAPGPSIKRIVDAVNDKRVRRK